MKKILLVLLSLMLVLFPSCDNEVKETASEPDYENNRTTIAIYKDGEVLDTEWDDYMMYFMRPLSKDKLSDSATFTVKNIGSNPAKVTMDLRSWRPGCILKSSVPDVLQPGESAEFTFTYSSEADKGILPSFYMCNLSIYGNFKTKGIDFKGSKTDVPIMNLYAQLDNVNNSWLTIGTDEYRSSKLRVANYLDKAKREISFTYRFYNEGVLDSIEFLGNDADLFSLQQLDSYNITLGFTPHEIRNHEATIRFHIKTTDNVEYIRDLDITVDVIETCVHIFKADEFYIGDSFTSMGYIMTSRSDGHAFLNTIVNGRQGFIEINERDEFEKWYEINDFYSGVPVDSWINESTNALYILSVDRQIGMDSNSLAFFIEEYGVFAGMDSNKLKPTVLKYPDYRYLCQSKDYLVFADDNKIMMLDKRNLETLPAIPTDTPVIDVVYDEKHLDYTIASDKALRIARYHTDGGLEAGRNIELGEGFSGNIKKILQVDDGYYVLNDQKELYHVLVLNLGHKVEKILTVQYAQVPQKMYFVDGSIYFYYENDNSPVIHKYSLGSGKQVSVHNLGEYENDTNMYMTERNGKLYFSTTCKMPSGKPSGYIRRIPLI